MQHQSDRTSRALRDTFGSQTAPSPAIRSRCRLLTCPQVRTRRSTPAFRRSDHEGAGPEAASVRMVIRINRQQGRPAQLNIGTFAFAGPARKCRSANAFTAPQNRQRVWTSELDRPTSAGFGVVAGLVRPTAQATSTHRPGSGPRLKALIVARCRGCRRSRTASPARPAPTHARRRVHPWMSMTQATRSCLDG